MASRVLSLGLREITYSKNAVLARVFGSNFPKINQNETRGFRKAYPTFLKTMKTRRKIAGPGPSLRKSDCAEWNYSAELFAFNKRLHENISEEDLRCAFVHELYVEKEKESRKELDVANVSLDLKANTALAASGHNIMVSYLKRYLRCSYPLLPEDGIDAVTCYLLSDDVLAHVSSHLGTKDLIFSAEYPPSPKTLSDTLKAVIGAIASSDSAERAEGFVLDFVCPQLIGKDVLEIWEINDPLELVNGILRKQDRELAEPRLIFESGRHTIEAIYQVGLYSEKRFLGKGFGETLEIAEEMAAYDTLRRMFGLSESVKPLPLGDVARKTNFPNAEEHKSVSELTEKDKDLKKKNVSVM